MPLLDCVCIFAIYLHDFVLQRKERERAAHARFASLLNKYHYLEDFMAACSSTAMPSTKSESPFVWKT